MTNKSVNDSLDDVRDNLVGDSLLETDFGVPSTASQRVEPKRIFGLTAGERMILSIIFFLAVSVLSVALLFLTNTIVIP